MIRELQASYRLPLPGHLVVRRTRLMINILATILVSQYLMSLGYVAMYHARRSGLRLLADVVANLNGNSA